MPEGGRLGKFEPLHDRHAILNVVRESFQKQGKLALPMGDLGFFTAKGLRRYKMLMCDAILAKQLTKRKNKDPREAKFDLQASIAVSQIMSDSEEDEIN